MAKKKSASDEYPMDEAKIQEMRAYLELKGNRVEILEYLDKYAQAFPEWLVKINESMQHLIRDKEGKNISCDKEREILGHVGLFLIKMASSGGLISDWYREKALGKELTEQMLNRLSGK
jgi:hypothetical protein